jgi:DNA-directed RNA polymerase specialized sigma24 family protein
MTLMPERNKLSEKENKLIEGCINGDKEAENEFDGLFRRAIFLVAWGFAANKEEADDLTQEILWRCYVKMKERRPTQNLRAWVLTLATNHCRNKYRERKPKEALYDRSKAVTDQYKNPDAIPPGSREYHRKDDGYINNDTPHERKIPQRALEAIEFSIKLVEVFYSLKKHIMSDPANYERIFKVNKILFDAQKEVKRVVGRVSERKRETYDRLRATPAGHLSDSEKRKLEKLKKLDFQISTHKILDESVRKISVIVKSIAEQAYLSSIMDKSSHSGYYIGEYYFYFLFDFALKLRKMKIMPPRLMFCVWASCFKKGKNTDLETIKDILSHFKRETKGTGQEFLFDLINEEVSTFKSIRQSQYKKSANSEYFNKLVDFIYKYSFKPEKVPDFIPGEWIKEP